jgi:hypothetical protein
VTTAGQRARRLADDIIPSRQNGLAAFSAFSERIRENTQHVSLASDPEFQAIFVRQMGFPGG